MKKKWKKVLAIVFAALLVIVIGAVVAFHSVEANLEDLAAAEIGDVDLSTVADGTYTGQFKTMPIEVIVEVTVKDHAITKIDLLKHSNGQGQDAEVIPSRVVEAQSLQVDSVTGATYSSKAILVAIKDALTQ